MFPYHDENKTQRTPIVTMIVIALNVLAWLLVEGAGATVPLARAVCDLGLIPGELTASLSPGTRFPMGDGLVCATDPGRQSLNLLTSMFLHGSWMHLLGNMWFLWLFGKHRRFHDATTLYRVLPAVRTGSGAGAGGGQPGVAAHTSHHWRPHHVGWR